MTSFMKDKDRFLNMGIIEKRKHYKCKQPTFITDLETWEDYYKSNKRLIKRLAIQEGYFFLPNTYINEKVSVWLGDITTLEIDAIVNAANNELIPGGGVDNAIHKAAGSTLAVECKALNNCKTGDAKITGGYMLPARYVIHTAGPRGEREAQLVSCYKRCLELCVENKLTTVAFPSVSTGVYGYPKGGACFVALKTVRAFLDKHGDKIQRVIFCVFEPEDLKIYQATIPMFFPVPPNENSPPSSPETKCRTSLNSYYN